MRINSCNFSLDTSLGDYKAVTGVNQVTSNFQDMNSYISGAIFTATSNTTITNTTAESSIIPSGLGTRTLPANFLAQGKRVSIKAYGSIATTGTPTLRIKVSASGVVVIDSGIITLSAITGTGLWSYEAVLDCRSVGVSGILQGQGSFLYHPTPSTLSGGGSVSASATIDTTLPEQIDIVASWGTASPSNVLICTNATLNIDM